MEGQNQDYEAVLAIRDAALKAAKAFARFNRTYVLTTELQILRRRSEHFATHRWMRPYWRLRVWFKQRQFARL